MAVNKLVLILSIAVKLPNDLLGILFREGSWKLCYPTDAIIEHFIINRTVDDANKLRQQLSQPFFQSRWNLGRINPIFHHLLDPESLLDGEEYQDSLFRIEMLVEGKKQKANITFVTGRLYAVELPKPIKFYEGRPISFGTVTRGKSSQSFTRAIDRAEHGRDPENT